MRKELSVEDTNQSIDVINRLLSERADRFSQTEDEDTNEDLEEMIVFTQEGASYAIPLKMLTELKVLNKLTSLPKTSENILGIINVRGRLVAVYKLNIDHASENSKPVTDVDMAGYYSNGASENKFVLIGHGVASEMAILADDIVGTKQVSEGDVRQKPISLNDKDYVVGLGTDGLIYLDLERFVSNSEYFMA